MNKKEILQDIIRNIMSAERTEDNVEYFYYVLLGHEKRFSKGGADFIGRHPNVMVTMIDPDELQKLFDNDELPQRNIEGAQSFIITGEPNRFATKPHTPEFNNPFKSMTTEELEDTLELLLSEERYEKACKVRDELQRRLKE